MPSKKIAIVYDWIDKWGGVERVLLTMHEMFPQADFFTSYYDPKKAGWAKDLTIKTSFIQKLPQVIRSSRLVSFPFYPYAFESFNFNNYDLVISVTSSFAKSVITKPETLHVCYLLTPTRYLWVNPEQYLNKPVSTIMAGYIAKTKEWDFVAAQRPDKIISISQTVVERCKKFYKRNSEVLYPPFDVKYWNNVKSKVSFDKLRIQSKIEGKSQKSKLEFKNQKFFLVVSRLEPYKRIDLILHLINKLKKNLVIVGDGSQLQKLRQIAGETVTFLSNLSDLELGFLYSKAEALIMPQEEDFGYVALEAQFFGCPVIALNKGGATETVIENKTGIFFSGQSVKSLQDALKRFDVVKYEIKQNTLEFGIKNLEKFSKEKFTRQFLNII